MYPYFIVDLTEVVKIAIPSLIAFYVLWRQLNRNREMQAESTFFNLLNSIRSLVANTEGKIVSIKKETYTTLVENKGKGIEYFFKVNNELQNRLLTAMGDKLIEGSINSTVKDAESIRAAHQIAVNTYNSFFRDHITELAHYYRFTYNVFTFIDTHPDMPSGKKKQYVKFIQSQMSDSELQLLFFNGIGQHGKKYYDLIEKYNFLENITTSGNNGMIEFLQEFYPASSFRL